MGIKREYSLRNNRDFQQLYASGKKYISNSFILFYTPATDLKAGFVASKKTMQTAPKRNRSKRILREIFRQVLLEQDAPTGHFVLVVRSVLLEKSFLDIKQEFIKCLNRLSLR